MAACVFLGSSPPALTVRTDQMTCFSLPSIPSSFLKFITDLLLTLQTASDCYFLCQFGLLSITVAPLYFFILVFSFYCLFPPSFPLYCEIHKSFLDITILSSEGFSLLPCKPVTWCKHTCVKAQALLVVFSWNSGRRSCCSIIGSMVGVVVEELKGCRASSPSGSSDLLKMEY